MIRTMLVLLAGCVCALAQDDSTRILETRGGSLEDFRVTAQLGRIDHTSAKGLAESFARAENDRMLAARTLRQSFESLHLEILERYCDKSLVKEQRGLYESRPASASVIWTRVVSVEAKGDDAAVAELELRWRKPGTGDIATTPARLNLVKRGSLWWIAGVEDKGEGGEFAERKLVLEAEIDPVTVPGRVEADLSGAQKCIRGFKAEITRLRLLSQRGRRELYGNQPKFAAAFFGEEAAAKLERKADEGDVEKIYEVSKAIEAEKGRRRVTVTALEQVPDEPPGTTSPVGQAIFELAKVNGKWRVIAEYFRFKIDKPFHLTKENYGLFFLQ